MAEPAKTTPMRAVMDADAADADADGREGASEEEIMKDASDALGELFNVQPPRDALAGLWSGVKCVFCGVFFGLACLVMQPIEAYRESGATGCFRGVVVGLFTGLFFSITGVCTGVFQAVRGIVATPTALCMIRKGWRWNSKEACWTEPVRYSLRDEFEAVLRDGDGDEDEDVGCAGSADSSAPGSRRRVADMYYYDQLGVAPGASQNDIRKAYFKQSRQWHPDKTSEPDAKARFQAISEAYQVLSDPDRRKAYDKNGLKGAGEGFIDAKVFFSVLLGADALAPYVGRLRIAEMFGEVLPEDDHEEDDTAAPGAELKRHMRQAEASQARQVRRQVRLAVDLAERLDDFVESQHEVFYERARAEASELLHKDPALSRFIAEIGWMYRNRGELYLARVGSRFGSFGIQSIRISLRGTGRKVGRQATTAKLAVASIMKLRDLVKEADTTGASGQTSTADAGEANQEATSSGAGQDGNTAGPAPDDDDELPESWNQALPVFMETFWSLSAHDITGTLDRVTERVLLDASVSDERRRRRALGLCTLGAAFETAAAAPTDGRGHTGGPDAAGSSDDDKRRRFEEAFVASLGATGSNGASGASR